MRSSSHAPRHAQIFHPDLLALRADIASGESMIIYHIGHGAYNGANAYKGCRTYMAALFELQRRGIATADATRVLKQAQTGSHATCRNARWDVIEVSVSARNA
jgi:hypothetical protein